jgi:hypothetical protein
MRLVGDSLRYYKCVSIRFWSHSTLSKICVFKSLVCATLSATSQALPATLASCDVGRDVAMCDVEVQRLNATLHVQRLSATL